MALMLAAELVALRRIVARRGPITHSSQFSRGKELQLPHAKIISPPTDKNDPRLVLDHANLLQAA
ncbi:MAG TPA: hypothetical protein VGP16_00310 [Asanoa sp.]|nr:hypothetical protein [Asanoa sp.]